MPRVLLAKLLIKYKKKLYINYNIIINISINPQLLTFITP